MNPGIHNITNEQYHASEGISRSAIMSFRKSPFHYHWEYILGNKDKEPTDAMVLGNAMHTFILEPETFNDRFYVWQKQNRTTKEGKESWQIAQLDAGTRQIINSEDFEKIQMMSLSLHSNDLARKLVVEGHYEQSIYWTDEETGLLCKCRPDIWQKDGTIPFIGDLKSIHSADFRTFQNDLYSRGYYIQAAMIYEGLKVTTGIDYKDFVFIAMEKYAPYPVVCYMLDELALMQGIADFKESLRDIKMCMDNDNWPTYQNSIVGLPAWA